MSWGWVSKDDLFGDEVNVLSLLVTDVSVPLEQEIWI